MKDIVFVFERRWICKKKKEFFFFLKHCNVFQKKTMSFTRLSNVFQEIIVRLSTSFRKNCGFLHRSCQPLRRRIKSTCHDVCEAIQQRLPERVELERNLLGGVVRAALRKPLPASLPARLRSGSFSICCITDCRKDAHKITFILSFLFRDKQRGSNMPNINKPGGSSSL